MDPAKNLEIGSRFLGFLWKHFDAARRRWPSPATTRARRAVDRWLGERGDLAMDEFMETIPYDETRNYTKRVLASYFTYSWLYGTNPVPSLPLAARGKAHGPDDGEGSASTVAPADRRGAPLSRTCS